MRSSSSETQSPPPTLVCHVSPDSPSSHTRPTSPKALMPQSPGRTRLMREMRSRTSPLAQAEASRRAAEEDAKRLRILADAKAYEISTINKAASGNPAYIQLQSLDALKQMSKDPAAKLYFMDSNSPSPLPLMNIGDPVVGKR